MPNYSCSVCNFITNKKSNYSRHIESKRHQRKVIDDTNGSQTVSPKLAQSYPILADKDFCKSTIHNKLEPESYTCVQCSMIFKHKSSLSRHKQRCMQKKLSDMQLQHELELVKKELEIAKEKESQYKEREQQYKDDVDYYKKLVEMAGDMAKTSTRTLSYLIKNHQNAPRLKKIGHQRVKQLEYQNRPHTLETIIMTHYQQKTLVGFLGDFLVSIYKHSDITKQSLWSTDTSRLTYVIRDYINKKPKWAVDKKGIKTKSQIIDPLLDHIQTKLLKAMEQVDIKRSQFNSHDAYFKAAKRYGDTVVMARQLTDGFFADKILKHITPYLFFDSE